MLSDEFLDECGKRHGYSYFPILAECMTTMTERKEKGTQIGYARQEIKLRIRDMVAVRTPYSHYLPNKRAIDVDSVCDAVRADSTMASDRARLYDPSTLHLEFDYVKEKIEESLKRLRKHIYATNRMDVEQNDNIDGSKLHIRILHQLMFGGDVPCCYICQRKATKFTLSPSIKKKGNPAVSEKYHTLAAWVDHDGEYVPMTVDHKLARALGGKDWFDNIDVACDSCNAKKAAYETKIANHNHAIEEIETNATVYPFQYRFYQ